MQRPAKPPRQVRFLSSPPDSPNGPHAGPFLFAHSSMLGLLCFLFCNLESIRRLSMQVAARFTALALALGAAFGSAAAAQNANPGADIERLLASPAFKAAAATLDKE